MEHIHKKRCVTKDQLKHDLLHYFLHNEIKDGEPKDIASVIDQFVPNPHKFPIEALKQAIKEKKYVFLYKFYQLKPVLPPVDGEARKNNWVMRVTFKYGRYFRYEMEYFNSYDHNRKECYSDTNRYIRYKRKEPLDDKALYFLRDLILTNMHYIKKGCKNKVFGSYWQYCGRQCMPGHHECKHCVHKRLTTYFREI